VLLAIYAIAFLTRFFSATRVPAPFCRGHRSLRQHPDGNDDRKRITTSIGKPKTSVLGKSDPLGLG
jgi:hypothetical protein